MRIVYMGTPDFAVPALKKLHEMGEEIVAVYTQPDRPRGRGKKLMPSPVKEAAEQLGLPVRQPEKLRTEEEVEWLKMAAPELILVAAYGQILPKSILEIPGYGCVNLHASLLPQYRGAAPVEAAILAGDEKTGVTVMQMEEGLDTGDMLMKAELPITEKDTAGSLTEKLAECGAELLPALLAGLKAGSLIPEKQKNEESSYAGKITRDMGKLDFGETAEALCRRIRGLNPHAVAYASLGEKNLKILFARVADEVETLRHMEAYRSAVSQEPASQENGKKEPVPQSAEAPGAARGKDREPVPGEVLQANKKGIAVMTGKGVLVITELQPEGKKAMPAAAYLNGYPVKPGEMFA